MSLHKLTAGSGYDYLTRQVAAMDATDKGHTGLASYYTEKGETPGVWVGSGMEGYGYSTEFEVERLYRDAILMSIGEGTNDVLRTVVAKSLQRGETVVR